MKPHGLALERSAPHALADWLTLTKPRIAAFVALAAFVGGLLGAGPEGDLVRVAEAALWITLSAAAASIFNQVLERDTDRLMARTADRPLPTGRIGAPQAILAGAALGLGAALALALRFGTASAALALGTLFAYVAIYTPLKRVSSLNTTVGAIPGAAPPLIGYVALAGEGGRWAWALFALVFVWQFPHFLAIAWLHRADYARAGLKMLPSLPGGEAIAGRSALVHALVLLPVVLLPGAWGDAGAIYTFGALALSLAYAAAAARFAWKPDAASARFLLFASLIHLPGCLALVLLDPAVGLGILHR